MNKNRKNVILGIAFIIFGILLFLSNTGVLAAGFWRYLVTFGLLVAAINWIIKKNYYPGMYALVLVLRYFPGKLPHQLMQVSTFTMFVIATLFASGLTLIFGTQQRSEEMLSGPHIKTKNSFSETSKYIYSDNLQSADLVCSFGQMSVYFNDSTLQNDVQINVDCSFGELELFFPKEWLVRENIKVTFGDVRSIVNFSHSDYVVYINGSVTFGDIKISYI